MQRVIVDMDEVMADPMGDMIEWYKKEYKLDVDNLNLNIEKAD